MTISLKNEALADRFMHRYLLHDLGKEVCNGKYLNFRFWCLCAEGDRIGYDKFGES